MKTAIYSDIDGYQVIVGFGDAQIDPVVTMRKIQDKVLALPELAQCQSVKTKIQAQYSAASNSMVMAKQALKDGNQAKADAYTAQYNSALAQIPVIEEELKPLTEAYEKARNQLFMDSAHYSTPSSGEAVISDADYQNLSEMFDNLEDDEKLSITGEMIIDYRGKKWWKKGTKWESGIIEALGVNTASGAVLESELNEKQKAEIEEQIEAERISSLTTDEKEAEKNAMIQNAAREAVEKKQMAEITGEEFDASAWYAEKKAGIEAKYA